MRGTTHLSLVQWVGGKGTQLHELLGLIPYTERYVEPYGGGASVLFNRRPSPVEVYNDLNENVVTLFRVVRDEEMFRRFERLVEATLFSKAEFARALSVLTEDEDPVHRAWALYTIQNQGISGKHHKTVGNWSRSLQDSKNTDRWWGRFEKLVALHTRLRNVQIDCQDAFDCMTYWDSSGTTFYIDPPYVLSTRDQEYYEFETDDDHHAKLVDVLLGLEGAVVLSGYSHPLYEPLVDAGWAVDCYSTVAHARITSGAKPSRVEMVWRNPQAFESSGQRPLFLL